MSRCFALRPNASRCQPPCSLAWLLLIPLSVSSISKMTYFVQQDTLSIQGVTYLNKSDILHSAWHSYFFPRDVPQRARSVYCTQRETLSVNTTNTTRENLGECITSSDYLSVPGFWNHVGLWYHMSYLSNIRLLLHINILVINVYSPLVKQTNTL